MHSEANCVALIQGGRCRRDGTPGHEAILRLPQINICVRQEGVRNATPPPGIPEASLQ